MKTKLNDIHTLILVAGIFTFSLIKEVNSYQEIKQEKAVSVPAGVIPKSILGWKPSSGGIMPYKNNNSIPSFRSNAVIFGAGAWWKELMEGENGRKIRKKVTHNWQNHVQLPGKLRFTCFNFNIS